MNYPNHMTNASSVAHDFRRRGNAQTLRERKVLSGTTKPAPQYPLDASQHMRRLLRTEYLGGLVIGFIFGFAFLAVSLALSSPAWVPFIHWIAK